MLKNLSPHRLFFLLFSLPLIVFAQQKNFVVQKKEPIWLEKVITVEKKPSKRDIKDGYYLFLFEQQHNIATQEAYQHSIRQIDSDNGVQNGSEITVTYDPSYQKLIFHKVVVWRDNVAINRLDARRFKVIQNEKELSSFIYSGTFDAYLILDDVRKGDRIEYSYTIKGENPVFKNRYNNTFYLEGGSKISNLYLSVIVPKNRTIEVKNFNDVPKLNIIDRGENRVYTWQNELTKTYQTEDFEPSWYDPFARVQISEIKTWKEIVDWAIQLNNYDLTKSTTLNRKVRELKSKSANNTARYFEYATRFVQDEIRYMGIEMGEYSHRPNSPEKVLNQRYGDCKDKSLLLIQLLKANGINAYPVYINTYLKDKTKDILPTTGAFNHAVVLAEYEGKRIWIDPTITDQRGPIQKNYFPYNANLLVIKPGNDKLELIKSNPTGKIDAISIIKVPDTLAGNKAELTVKTTYTANCADNLRSEISSSGLEEMEKNYLEYYAKYYPGVIKSKDIEVIDDEKSNTIVLTESYDIEDIWERNEASSTKFDTYFYGDLINSELRHLKKSRPVPFSLKYPVDVHQAVKIILPEKWSFNDEDLIIDRKDYYFKSTVKYNLDTLVLDYVYQNKTDQIEPAATKQYVKDLNQITENISYYISWNGNVANVIDKGNNMLISVSIVVWMLGIAIANYIYHKKESFNLEEIKNARPIGGWLIVIAFIVVIAPFTLIYSTYSSGSLNMIAWNNIKNTYGDREIFLKVIIVFECVVNTLLSALSILVAILFFKRRKIFPKAFIIFRSSMIIFSIADMLLSHIAFPNNNMNLSVVSENIRTVTQVIVSIILIIYFLRSSRVKETFVFTYPTFVWRNKLIMELSAQINVPFPDEIPINEPFKIEPTLDSDIKKETGNNEKL